MKKMHKILTGSVVLSSVVLLAACSGEQDKEAKTDTDGNIVMTVGQQTQPNSKLPDGDSYADNAYRRLIKEELGVSIERVHLRQMVMIIPDKCRLPLLQAIYQM